MANEYSYNLVLNAALHGNLIVAANGMSKSLRKLYTEADSLRSGYNRMVSALNSGGFSQASAQATKYRQELRQLSSQIVANEAQQRKVHFNDSMGRAVGAYQNMMSTLGKAKEIASPLVGAVTTAADFEAAMSKVGAISGATGEDMKKLTDTAKQLGATTMFSASQSAEAMNYLAMAGWKTESIVKAMPGLLNLAAASGEDLATVSDILSDDMTAFGISADKAGHVADVFAAAASNANTNVSMLGEAFKYAGPVAGALGYSLEDVSVAAGLMANASIKGSMAGTALRSIMTRMIEPPKDAANAMAALGIEVKNADGTVKPFGQTLKDLRNKFSSLNEAEKAKYANWLAGQEAMGGLLAIVNASDDDFNKLSGAINQCDGKAADMAKTMQANAKGALTQMKSAMEGISIAVGSTLLPALRDLTVTASQVAGSIAEWSMAHPEMVKIAIDVAGLVTGVIVLGQALKTAGESLTALQAGFNMLTGSGPLPMVPGTTPNLQPAPMPVAGGNTNMFGKLKASATKFSQELATLGSLAVTKFTTPFKAAGGIFKTLGGVFAENTVTPFLAKIGTLFSGIGGKIAPLLANITGPIKMLFTPLITMLSGPLTAAFGGVIASFGGLAAAALPIIGIIAGIVAVGAILYSNWETIANVAQVVWDKVQACWGAAMERLQPAFESIGQSLDRLGTTFSSFGGQSTILETIFNTLGSVITAAFMVGITAIEVFVNAFAGAFEIISTTINEIGVIIQALAEGDWAAAWNSMGNIVSTIVSGIISTVSNMVSSVANGIKSIMGLSPGGGGAGVDVSANAEGGIYNKGAFLTTFAETGPEAAIPLNGSSRGQSLWEQAGEIGGYSTSNNSSSNSYNISIPVNISGSVDNSAVGNITS